MVERLRRGHRHYQHNIQQAIGGGTCEHRPGGCQEEECPFNMPAVVEAETAFEQGDFAEAAEHFGAELDKGCSECPRDGEYRKYPKWREATLRVLKARSLRRARQLHHALEALDPVMRLCSPSRLALGARSDKFQTLATCMRCAATTLVLAKPCRCLTSNACATCPLRQSTAVQGGLDGDGQADARH